MDTICLDELVEQTPEAVAMAVKRPPALDLAGHLNTIAALREHSTDGIGNRYRAKL